MSTGESGAGIPALALGAWWAVGLGAALRDGSYSAPAVLLVAAGTGLLLLAFTIRPDLGRIPAPFRRAGLVGAALTPAIVALLWPAGVYGAGPWLRVSHLLTLVSAAGMACWFMARLPRPAVAGVCVVALQGLAGVAVILASPRPPIDDWIMMQAAARGLSRGQDIYTVAWHGPLHEASNLFAYLPGSAVLVWPFHAVFGDVRYGVLAALVATGLLLLWVTRGSPMAMLACLPVLFPNALFGVEQSWIDPLVLLAVCATGAAVWRRRPGWAVVFFAVALACKQQAWLLLPLAMAWRPFGWRRGLLSAASASVFTLPWALADLHRFVFDVFQYQLHLAPRRDSLSLFTTALAWGLHPRLGWLVAALACVLALALRNLRGGEAGFLLAGALVMSVFNLMNKQSFFNEWALSAGLAAAAAAFAVRGPVRRGAGPLEPIPLTAAPEVCDLAPA